MTEPRETMSDDEWEAHWAEQIRQAQLVTYVLVDGKPFDRIAWGSEPPPPIPDRPDLVAEWQRIQKKIAGTNCHDCAAAWGQFHVPYCDMERCPVCLGQLIFCNCDDPKIEFPPPPGGRS